MIFHVIHVFEGFSANVASEKCLIFIFFMASFVDEQIVLLVKGSVTNLTIVCFHRHSALFPTENPGLRMIGMNGKHLQFNKKKFGLEGGVVKIH